MSGIYIPGMEMPTGDDAKLIAIIPTGEVLSVYLDNESGELGLCPMNKTTLMAIHVPDHGRLIDADAFESIKYELPDGQKAFNRGFHSGVQYVQRMIVDAPTIIPADLPVMYYPQVDGITPTIIPAEEG